MADRYPLIFDTIDNKFKELPSGDNLNLNNSGIVNANSIVCDGVIVGRPRYNVYAGAVVSSNITLTTADCNKVVLVNTLAPRTIVLPQGSTLQVGDWVRIVDVGSGETNTGNSFVNNITIDPFGSDRIQGGSAGDTLIMDVDGQALTLMWCGSTFDWRIVN